MHKMNQDEAQRFTDTGQSYGGWCWDASVVPREGGFWGCSLCSGCVLTPLTTHYETNVGRCCHFHLLTKIFWFLSVQSRSFMKVRWLKVNYRKVGVPILASLLLITPSAGLSWFNSYGKRKAFVCIQVYRSKCQTAEWHEIVYLRHIWALFKMHSTCQPGLLILVIIVWRGAS